MGIKIELSMELSSLKTNTIKVTYLHEFSCLENPRDGRAWWAAVYGVAQSLTRLK